MYTNNDISLKEKRNILSSIKRGGDAGRVALEKLYHSYDYRLYLKLLSHTTKNANHTDNDILHDAILIFRDNVIKGKVDIDQNLDVYITSIAKNLFQNLTRQKKLEYIVDENMPIYGVEESIASYYNRKEATSVIEKLLNMLPEKCQEILKMWQQDFSYENIAEMVGLISASAARKKKLRCFNKLKNHLPSFPELKTFLSYE